MRGNDHYQQWAFTLHDDAHGLLLMLMMVLVGLACINTDIVIIIYYNCWSSEGFNPVLSPSRLVSNHLSH